MSAVVDTSPLGASCGCAAGDEPEAPIAVTNRPGLSAIAYRVGTWGSFRASMIAALSRSDLPALRALTSREPSDFSIALLDAWAMVGDVLTFYQERNANEAYLRTATERLSVAELAGLIGYAPRPGVAADVLLAFDVDDARGAPETTTLDVGTKVQSIPGAGETSQTFETIEAIEARPVWNGLKPLATHARSPTKDDWWTYLQGTSTGLRPGDGVLILGGEREHTHTSTNWDFRRVESVVADTTANRTLVTWTPGLGKGMSTPAKIAPRFFAMRQRASLFGHNAPDFYSVTNIVKGTPYEKYWAEWGLPSASEIELDAVYPQVATSSWIVIAQEAHGAGSSTGVGAAPPAASAYTELYQVNGVHETSVARFLVSGKATRVELDHSDHLTTFAPRYASVFVQSEELFFADGPYVSATGTDPSNGIPLADGVPSPVEGSAVTLDRYVPGLKAGKTLIVSGRRTHLQANRKPSAPITLVFDDPNANPTSRALAYREMVEVIDLPVNLGGGAFRIHVRTLDKQLGTITCPGADLFVSVAPTSAEVVSEPVVIQTSSAAADTTAPTALGFLEGLTRTYDRASVSIFGNVAHATHGETVHEVLGNGDAGTAFPTFTLKQAPLTYVRSDGPSGAVSTLAMTIQGVVWHEVDALNGRGPTDRVFVTSLDDDGKTTLELGDGHEGARAPSGNGNVLATYRKGIGTAGNVAAGKITLLAARPLGVRGVTNPLPATGGGDRESRDDARGNAGLTIQTLDRVVSIQDYGHFARAFAGVAKASADWVWDGFERCVLLSIAAEKGAQLDPTSPLHDDLLSALKKAGDPFVPVLAVSYRPVAFRVGLQVKVDEADYLKADVLTAVEAALRAAYTFDARDFGEPVTLAEITALAQDVTGVIAVRVTHLHRADETPPATPHGRLVANPPSVPPNDPGHALGAELLTLDSGPLLELGDLA